MSSPLGTWRVVRSVPSAVVGAVALLMALATPVDAAAGDLDPTFGTGGLVTTNFGRGEDVSYPVALQPDGKIVVAGEVFTTVGSSQIPGDTNRAMGVVRYNANGSLDATFGSGGLRPIDFGPFCSATDVAIQVDRSRSGFTLSMPEAGECDTTSGPGTLEIAGEATGAVTCAGGVASGRASVTLVTPAHGAVQADVGALRIASKAGLVTLHVHVSTGTETIVLDGELVQSHTVLSTCLNNSTPVFWHGRLVVEEGWVV